MSLPLVFSFWRVLNYDLILVAAFNSQKILQKYNKIIVLSTINSPDLLLQVSAKERYFSRTPGIWRFPKVGTKEFLDLEFLVAF